MNSHAAVTFSCAAHTLLLFMISFGVSCRGLIQGTGGANSSRGDACNAGGGERCFLHSTGLGGREGRPVRALEFGGRDPISLARLRPHYLRPAGATLALVRVTWARGGKGGGWVCVGVCV